MTVIAMLPARMGSQRLRHKNLRELAGVPLITRAIRKCLAAGVFDEVWVNSEHPRFGEIAAEEGVRFHRRPAELGNDQATSEQYVYEFLSQHPCEILVQVHSIAPLLTVDEVRRFVQRMRTGDDDVLISAVAEQIECAFDGAPVNFSYQAKTNSQDLRPVHRVSWSITAWRSSTYRAAYEAGRCATYAGKVAYYEVGRLAGHVIKTAEDLRLAEVLLPLIEGE